MRYVTDEFYGMPREKIEDAIVKDSEGNPLDFNSELGGLNTSLVRLDTLVEAVTPDKKNSIRIRFNIETQAVANPGYLITNRAQSYAAMLLATQNKDCTGSKKYTDLRKVYTVWVCLNPSGEEVNSVNRFGMLPHPSNVSCTSIPSLMEIILINLCKIYSDEGPSITDLLNLIFSVGTDDEKRQNVLKKRYNLEVDLELIREVRQMTDWLTEAREVGHEEGFEQGREEGFEQGMKEGMKEGIDKGVEQERNRNKNLLADSVLRVMQKNNLDKKTAMDLVCIPEEYWDDVSTLVDSRAKEVKSAS